jgi:hypothetical protein
VEQLQDEGGYRVVTHGGACDTRNIRVRFGRWGNLYLAFSILVGGTQSPLRRPRRVVPWPEPWGPPASWRKRRRACRCRTAAPAIRVPAGTNITLIGVANRDAPKNSRDCDDRIPEPMSAVNSAAGAALTYKAECGGARRRQRS